VEEQGSKRGASPQETVSKELTHCKPVEFKNLSKPGTIQPSIGTCLVGKTGPNADTFRQPGAPKNVTGGGKGGFKYSVVSFELSEKKKPRTARGEGLSYRVEARE
jgi:hypothetical protein